MAGSDDATLMKVAVFSITISIMCTLLISLMYVETSDYDYDDITAYRNDLISFSGESMINETPWILTGVYTPWNSSLDAGTHTDADGWLYGESVQYSDLGKSAYIHLDPNQKSSAPLTFTSEAASYVTSSTVWWGSIPVIGWIGTTLGFDDQEYTTNLSDNWNYTGYRYVFDPTLPFKDEASTVDGSLSMVWYSYNSQEGLSGGLDIYGGTVKLANYSATDIIADYNTQSGYATTYVIDFGGTLLNLSIRFNQNSIEDGVSLMQAWTTGDWTLAVSSVSAGNFLDIDNSVSFSTSIGSLIKTFIQIYTFSMPSISNEWMDLILWLLCGLPMTLAMACVVIRIAAAVIP